MSIYNNTISNIAHAQLSSALMEDCFMPFPVSDKIAWWLMDNRPNLVYTTAITTIVNCFTNTQLLNLYEYILAGSLKESATETEKVAYIISYLSERYPVIWGITTKGEEYWTVIFD